MVLMTIIVIGLFGCGKRTSESKWSKASNGVQVKLCSDSNYKVRDTIEIHVKFRNVGKTPQTITMPSLYATINMVHNGKGFADAIGMYPKGIEELEILPGQATKEFLLHNFHTKGRGAGKYEFSGGMGTEKKEWQWNFEKLSVHVSMSYTQLIIVIICCVFGGIVIFYFLLTKPIRSQHSQIADIPASE